MPKVIINDSQGLVQRSGSGLEINSSGLEINSEISLSSSPSLSVSALTSNSTLTHGGVYTASSSGALTIVMPLASAVAGSMFVVRALSAHAHVLTGSQESGGTLVFAGMPGATPNTRGSALTLPEVVGSSVVLVSDGKNFLLTAASGSCSISGT